MPSDPVYAVYAMKKGEPGKNLPEIILRDEPNMHIDRNYVESRKKEIKKTFQCPYCGHKLQKWIVPDNPFIEWDNEYFYICFNDECPFLIRGWKTMYSQGNRGLSHRLGYNHERDVTMAMPVHNLNSMKDGIVPD
jgi:hypothetical protein